MTQPNTKPLVPRLTLTDARRLGFIPPAVAEWPNFLVGREISAFARARGHNLTKVTIREGTDVTVYPTDLLKDWAASLQAA